MIRAFLPLLLLVVGAGTAAAADRTYSVTDFDRVVVEGPYVVRLTVGPPSRAAASGSARALDDVSVDVQGTTLRIRRNTNAWGGYPGRQPEPAVITLATRTLRSAALAGAGSLEVTGARGLQLDLFLAGSGRLAASALAVDNLTLSLRGSGTVALAGTAKAITANVEGSATLDAAALTAETATIGAATAGDIRLVARRAATVNATGLGQVEVSGAAACTLNGPRAADVRCGPAAR